MMKDVIKLIDVEKVSDGMGGQEIKVNSERKVFATRMTVRGNEFYQAYQSGIEVTKIFKVYDHEYDDERVIMDGKKYYTVVRPYLKGEFVELTCTRRSGLLDEVRA